MKNCRLKGDLNLPVCYLSRPASLQYWAIIRGSVAYLTVDETVKERWNVHFIFFHTVRPLKRLLNSIQKKMVGDIHKMLLSYKRKHSKILTWFALLTYVSFGYVTFKK